jgi:hypothetical protein
MINTHHKSLPGVVDAFENCCDLRLIPQNVWSLLELI